MTLVDLLPTMHAQIERRVFVTFRADPVAIRTLVPARYELLLHDGDAIGGVCLIRLGSMRPGFVPRWLGFGSRNAAHRISIIGPDGQPAIWAPRRDTDSPLNVRVGATMYPDAPGRAVFREVDDGSHLAISCTDADGRPVASVDATVGSTIGPGSTSSFGSLDELVDHYRRARCGYSPTRDREVDGRIDLEIETWNLRALDVVSASSTIFDPLVERGDAQFDHAVLMRDTSSRWSIAA